jgi:ribosomal protein S18 acetylase RimI-like enzyme
MRTGYDVRPASTFERSAVEQVVAEAYQPWASVLGFRPPPMDADYGYRIAAGQVYVTGKRRVDGVAVLVDEHDCLVVENVAVRPALQGQGIGRALLGFAEREAQRRGLPALRLYTHEQMTSNLALYTSLGYVETGREPVRAGYRVHLRKIIP